MTARSLRREMDRLHAKGISDGLRHDARDPAWFSRGKDGPYLRWAYDAGHREGVRQRVEWWANPDNGIPLIDVT